MRASRRILSILAAVCTVSCFAAPAFAQDLKVTLSNVTFNDGASASGYFDYNPTTNAIGTFDISTTNGTSDGLLGTTYQSSTSNSNPVTNWLFQFTDPTSGGNLSLECSPGNPIAGAGTFQLTPGTVTDPTSFNDSGEFAPVFGSPSQTSARAITGGDLVATVMPVPEMSTLGLFGFLLIAGAGVARTRRAKAIAA